VSQIHGNSQVEVLAGPHTAELAGAKFAIYNSGLPDHCSPGHVCPIPLLDTDMRNRFLVVVLSLAAAIASACTSFERKSSLNEPSAAGNNSLLGSWTSSQLIPTPSTCTDFKWTVSEQTATSAKGAFSATCPGDLKFTGTAQGVMMSPTAISWSADANATAPGLTSCSLKLTGTATIGVDSIGIPYSGDTCLGKVSGIETLKKR
jgi:hypothetical protein